MINNNQDGAAQAAGELGNRTAHAMVPTLIEAMPDSDEFAVQMGFWEGYFSTLFGAVSGVVGSDVMATFLSAAAQIAADDAVEKRSGNA